MVFLTVHQREPHARQMAFEEIAQPTSYAERCALAERTREELELTAPILIDTLDDQSRAYFGDLPSPAIVIGPDGVVRVKLPWAEPDVLGPRIERLLDELAAEEIGGDAPPRARTGAALRAVRIPSAGESARADLAAVLEELGDGHADLRALALAELAADDEGIRAAAVAARTAWSDDPARTAAALARLAVTHPDATASRALLQEIVALAGDDAPTQRDWARARLGDSKK